MENTRQIILASSSPRRKELLEKIGLSFKVDAGTFDEGTCSGLDSHTLAQKISLGKALSVAGKYMNAIIIGADTFVIVGNVMMGKPDDEDEACAMLKAISGRSHNVITGFAIIDTASGKTVSRVVETKVYIRRLTVEEIDAYIRTGEPLGKAGAYAIQGLGALFVERIEGDYYNVVGLPLCALMNTLKEFGVRLL
jgi:septum formation protein